MNHNECAHDCQYNLMVLVLLDLLTPAEYRTSVIVKHSGYMTLCIYSPELILYWIAFLNRAHSLSDKSK